MRLAGLQLQNHNSAVGYYEWEWAGFSLRGEKRIQPDLLPYTQTDTHSISTLHTHINIEKPDVDISWGENLLSVPHRPCDLLSL